MAPLETTVTPNSKDVREGGQEASPKRESGLSPPAPAWGKQRTKAGLAFGVTVTAERPFSFPFPDKV